MALKSIQQAADTWGVSVHTARRLAAAGLVRTVRVGRRRLVSEGEIERVVASGVPNPSGSRKYKHRNKNSSNKQKNRIQED